MDVKKYTCIVCPMSCDIVLKADNGKIIDVSGFTCKRGENFARNEYINPLRTLTTVVKLENSDYNCLPVISDGSIPKDMIGKSLENLKKISIKAPVAKGNLIVEDLLSTGVNIIAAKSVKERG